MAARRGSGAPEVTLDSLVEAAGEGSLSGVVVVAGDRVLSEPAARRLADALARTAGCEVSTAVRPLTLAPVLADLRTYSLFGGGKVTLVVESAALGDRTAAAELIDQAAEALPIGEDDQLSEKQREAAGRLVQALRLFGVELAGDDAERLLDRLPAWAFQGGSAFRRKRRNRGRGKKQVATLREGLVLLLERALAAGLEGWDEGELADLARMADEGLPDGHSLVLAESSVADDHPVVGRLEQRGAVARVGSLDVDRRGQVTGLEALAAELRRETGKAIDGRALDELVRRTVRRSSARGAGRSGGLDPDSVARLAAEYRKLAGVASGDRIDLETVRSAVEDRGEEDVWKLLDDIGAGRLDGALRRLDRLLLAAEDPFAARLSLFALVADFCRQLVAVRGAMELHGVRPGQRNYRRFQDGCAGRLQAELPGGLANPLAGLHPYRLHRVYLAASVLSDDDLRRLPWRVLETELRLKGESGDADTALASLLAAIGAAAGDRRGERRARA